MKPLFVNKRYNITIDEIEKIVDKGKIFWVYRKEGYPKIIKSIRPLKDFLLLLINRGYKARDIKEFKNRYVQ